MKVYVEKLPKGCLSCPYIVDKGDYDLCAIKDCVIDDAFKYIDKRKKSCPLLSLADYTKQVRKEVCEEIKSLGEPFPYKQGSEPYMWIISQKDLDTILKEYQK